VSCVERADVDRWLEAYVDAWRSYDRDEIAQLFAVDVTYRYHPYDHPVEGREAVVASWLGEDGGDGASARDEPGTYDASYRARGGRRGRGRRDGEQHVHERAGRAGGEGLRQLLRHALRRRGPLHGVHRVVHGAAGGGVTAAQSSPARTSPHS
jgi:hypothetical protein